MNPLIQPKTITSPLLITFTLLCFGFFSKAQAVVPPPDGGYPGFNTAEGQNALMNLTTGAGNTAVGWFSLWSDTDGSYNTAVGAGALLFNVGTQIITGQGAQNTAIGTAALLNNTTGSKNTATGALALFSNTEAIYNTATGYQALSSNTIGRSNTATGQGALINNITGSSNTADGANTLINNTTGSFNTAFGSGAGSGVTTANNVICIGADGNNVSDSCYIGNIFGDTSSGGTAVFINSNGRLGTATSSRRFKEEIKPMDRTSEALFELKPVAFRYKKDIDPAGTPQLGLVAEDVDKVNPDLVVRDKEGKPYSVRYDQVNAMLLNEFLKEHRKVEEQGREMQEQKAIAARQQKQIDALTAVVQKASAQLELNKPAPQTAQNTD